MENGCGSELAQHKEPRRDVGTASAPPDLSLSGLGKESGSS